MRIVLITTDTLRNPRGFENTSRVDPFSIVTSIASESGGLTAPHRVPVVLYQGSPWL
jgi:hypothetical protein